ncbi:MBL fold metallo-hydrolase [Flavobacterium silvaticum]|uniref:MBL fold metallo-hydrolase n=1 Tax=Flavobacterium silvaticum TaxID=1852020 RepID=A0A972JG36_9FLAO|nr:MBL fold metallo-hydrolase [Flavobacterium silvaticum]NMH28634.1 MBL fold metallo-hydrolase [Flavobacterium silvaticum]
MKTIRLLTILFVLGCIPNHIHAQFPLPPKVPIWDANTVTLQLHKLDENVYSVSPSTVEKETTKGIPQATSAGFIVGEKGVLLIETMLNKRLYDQLIALVRTVTDKPIVYAVNTSDHGDHCFGNYLLPKETIVIQNEFAKQNLVKNYDNIKQFMIMLFGAGRGIEESVYRPADIAIPLNQSIKIDLGKGLIVGFVNVGTAQSPADLFVFASTPSRKILWAGNPFIAESPAIPWLFDGYFLEPTRNLRKIYDMVGDTDIIIPGHGRITNKSGIKYTLDYVEALRKNVEAAVKKGLTLEQTKATLKMKDFDKGYEIFDWLHFNFNIPNAYNDIKGTNKPKS